MLDNLRHAPDHVTRAGLLPHLTIDFGRVVQLLRIANHTGSRNAGPDGREAVEGFGVAKLPAADRGGYLEVPGGDVVADCEAEDVVEGVGGGDVFGVFADDGGELETASQCMRPLQGRGGLKVLNTMR